MSSSYIPKKKLMSKAQLNEILCAMDSDNNMGVKFPHVTIAVVRQLIAGYQAHRGFLLQSDAVLQDTFNVAKEVNKKILEEELNTLRTLLVALPVADFHALLDSYSFRPFGSAELQSLKNKKVQAMTEIPALLRTLEDKHILPVPKISSTNPNYKNGELKEKESFVPRTHFHMKSNDWLISHGCSVQIKDGFRTIVTEENLVIQHEYDPSVNQANNENSKN